jgi:hypothetical protein
MRALGRDIVELFGFAPNDFSSQAVASFKTQRCPFVNLPCSKTNHDNSVVYGTCSVTGASKGEVIICPKRLYANDYRVLSDAANAVWSGIPIIVGGALAELKARASGYDEVAIAFGQNSGSEISIASNGKLSMDWVVQRYVRTKDTLTAKDYIGIEVQSIDTTGNYRDNWQAYANAKAGTLTNAIPNSNHGLNWANVHKRLIPQIIRKGNVYSKAERCAGFFFILPDVVYEKFEDVLGNLPEQVGPSRDHLSVLTYGLSEPMQMGIPRGINLHRVKHHSLADIAVSFVSGSGKSSSKDLDQLLSVLI